MKGLLKLAIHLFIALLLTILTQVGGLIWLLCYGYFKFKTNKRTRLVQLGSFIVVYLLVTLLLVPQLSKLNGRVALPIFTADNITPNNILIPLMNRNYVRKRMKQELVGVAAGIKAYNPDLKLTYLDACFPFINGFPLLPHRSHADGSNVDLSFYYLKDGKPSNTKPSNSGYGYFEGPKGDEKNKTTICKQNGHWQYDFTKYFTLGSSNDLEFDEAGTKHLLRLLKERHATYRIFIEPHLKDRLGFSQARNIKFQSCKAVRHDDHIHWQI